LIIWMVCPNAGSRIHGMNFRVYQFAREFVRLGHQVRVFTGTWSHQFVVQPPSATTYNEGEVDGIAYTWVKVSPYGQSSSLARLKSWAQFVWRLARLPRHQYPAPDVVIVSSPVPYTIFNGLLFRRRYGCRVVFEVRDLWPLSLVELGGYSKLHPFIVFTGWVERLAYRKADGVVTTLTHSRDYLVSRGVDPANLIVIPNGVEDPEIPQELEAPVQRQVEAFREQHTTLVAYTGSFNLSNASPVLLEVIRLCKRDPHVGFVLAGPEGPTKEELRQTIELENLANVLLLAPVTKAQVGRLLSHADIGFIGYGSETITKHGIAPTKIFDYLRAKLTVVLAASSEGNTFSGYPSVHLGPVGDAAAVRQEVLRLSAVAPGALKQAAAASLTRLETEFSLPQLAARYSTFLETLA